MHKVSDLGACNLTTTHDGVTMATSHGPYPMHYKENEP